MKAFLSFTLLTIICLNLSKAQIFELEAHFGNTQNCEIRGMDLDASGNVIVTGYFSQTVDFDPGPAETSIFGLGNSVGFIAKYSTGLELVWVKILETTTSFVPLELEIDGLGNIYVTGSLNGSVDMDPSAGEQTVSSSGNYNGFYAKYNSDGDLQWAFRLPGAGYGLGLDSDNNIYITGQFAGSKYFVGVEPPNVAVGTGDTFLSKYNSDGTFQWVIQLGGSGNEIGYDLSINSTNEIVTTGVLSSAADFDPGAGTVTLTNGGATDAYVAKYNSSGDYVWAFNFGSAGMTAGKSISVDSDDNVIVSGDFQNTIDMDPGGAVQNLISQGSDDIFLAKYSSAGIYSWAHSFGSSSSSEYTFEVEVDTENAIYLAGRLGFGADLDPDVGSDVSAYTGPFLANYTANGEFNWYAPLAFVSNSQIYEMRVNSENDIVLGGGIQVSGDLDPNEGYVPINNISSSGTDALILKYDKCILITNTVDEEACGGEEIMFGTQTLSETGQYSETFTAVNGCDSLVTLNLTVHPVYNEDVSITAYNGNHYFLGSQVLTESGNYTEVFSTVNDCDSTVNLTLQVSPFQGGMGTSEDPWQIATNAQLHEVRNYNEDYFILMNDLDLTAATSSAGGEYYNGGLGWDPIGDLDTPFEGYFDGNGFHIDGLTINRPAEFYVGLFGVSGNNNALDDKGSLKGTTLLNVNIEGDIQVGSLVGRIVYASVTNCSSSGTVDGGESTGGLVGLSFASQISESSSESIVSGSADVGGLLGLNVGGDVLKCFSNSEVTGSFRFTGGLVGRQSTNGMIMDSYASGNVSGVSKVGGLLGALEGGSEPGNVEDSYTVGNVAGDELVDGLVGFFEETNATTSGISQSFWNSELSCILGGSSSIELSTESHFTNWDFNAVWKIEEGTTYPYLQWQEDFEDFNRAIFSNPQLPDLQDVSGNCEIILPDPLPAIVSGCDNESAGTPNVNFPITTVGTTIVTWSYTDEFGNDFTQTQTFTVNTDEDAPVPNMEELEDLTGSCSVSLTSVPTAEDACEGTIVGETDTAFPITTQGTTIVTWTFEDSKGNVSSEDQNVIIDDDMAPVAEVIELLEITGICSVDAVSAPFATDNCSGQVQGQTEVAFPITTQGETIIKWVYSDENGNETIQNQTVIITDSEAPIPALDELPSISTDCDGVVASVSPPSATDNCAGNVTATTSQQFPFTATSESQILWEYDDGNGNTLIQVQEVNLLTKVEVLVDTTICEGSSFTFPDGTVWSGQSSQVSTLNTQLGCDSLVTTNVTVAPLPEVDLGEDVRFACQDEELTFSIDEAMTEFDTYTISTLFGNSATNQPLTFVFDQTFAATAATQDVFVTVEVVNSNGCLGTDQVLLKDNSMINWGIGSIQNNDPQILVSNTILPETADSFEWNFGDGSTNNTDINPTHTYTENGDYSLILTVTNECGSESLSTTLSISGVEEIENPLSSDDLHKVILYPNPVSDVLFVDGKGTFSISIYSLDGGKVLSSEAEGNTRLDLSALSSGQYFLLLSSEGKLIKTEKVIKVN